VTKAGLSRALFACLGIGAADVAALNLAVLPAVRASRAGEAPPPAEPVVAAPVVAATVTPPEPAAVAEVTPPPEPAPAPPVAPPPEPAPMPAAQPAPSREAAPTRELVAVVEFDRDSARVGLRAAWALRKAGAKLRGAGAILVVGHADATGTPDVNDRISVDRAVAVSRRLSASGIPAARIGVEGRGDREPRDAGNDRRVEIYAGGIP
jgi:outer membrane protein OmpA-like peptidoglycan-associated protein